MIALCCVPSSQLPSRARRADYKIRATVVEAAEETAGRIGGQVHHAKKCGRLIESARNS
jgi:hypothetical protein